MREIRALTLILLTAVVLYGCQKIPGHQIQPGTGGSSGGSGNSGGSGGGMSGSTIDITKGYMPTSAGSYTKYRGVIGTAVDTTTNTMTGNTTTINGKLYSVVNANSVTYGASVGYFSNINHVYTFRSTSIMAGVTVEFEYLIDNVPVGTTWTAPAADNGIINGIPARVLGGITETGISKTVSGIMFTNVIHTTLQLQYDLGTGFATNATYEYYIAKGVGVIEIDSNVSISGFPSITGTSTIIGFSIK